MEVAILIQSDNYINNLWFVDFDNSYRFIDE
jgi:hypothetical protein